MEQTMERNAIKEAVKEALKEELNAFYVDRELHYQHHEFIREWIVWSQQCKSVILKTVIGGMVAALLGLIVVGFIFKISGK